MELDSALQRFGCVLNSVAGEVYPSVCFHNLLHLGHGGKSILQQQRLDDCCPHQIPGSMCFFPHYILDGLCFFSCTWDCCITRCRWLADQKHTSRVFVCSGCHLVKKGSDSGSIRGNHIVGNTRPSSRRFLFAIDPSSMDGEECEWTTGTPPNAGLLGLWVRLKRAISEDPNFRGT